jgi:hypothetical protein
MIVQVAALSELLVVAENSNKQPDTVDGCSDMIIRKITSKPCTRIPDDGGRKLSESGVDQLRSPPLLRACFHRPIFTENAVSLYPAVSSSFSLYGNWHPLPGPTFTA